MSSYIYFYLKDKTDNYNYLNAFSRNHAIYEYGQRYARYDEGTPVTIDICNDIISLINTDISYYDNKIDNYSNYKTIIADCNNPIEEKLDAVIALDAEKESLVEDRDRLIGARNFYETVRDIVDANYWCSKTEDYIYFGIEWCPDYEEED